MTGRTMDLRPPAVRRRVADARERTRLVQICLLAAICLSAAWSAAAWRLRDARADHELAVTRADEVLRVERELADITDRFDDAGRRLGVWRRCSIPFGASSILASIANDLPDSGTLERVEFDAPSLITSAVRGGRVRSDVDSIRRIEAEIEGFTATDADVAVFVEALRRRPLFRDVRVESTRHRSIADRTARAFRIVFEIDLETASPVIATAIDPEGDE